MQLKPSKTLAIKAAIKLTPQYSEWIKEIQKNPTPSFFKTEVLAIQKNIGGYVLMYDDERKINRALFLALMGEERFQEYNAEIEALSSEEQQKWLEEMADPDNQFAEDIVKIEIPDDPIEWQKAREALALLPEDERMLVEKQSAFFWCFTFSSFFNTLSVMVHGSKLTNLVPQALAGNDDAFLKAIQIDRMLLLHYPFFRDRKFKAQDEGDADFLAKIAYRESNPIIRSSIRYPALYMLFSILDIYRWLDELKHKEILKICDDAGLDRFQNRIDDVGYLTKRLVEFRKWQNVRDLSMQSN